MPEFDFENNEYQPIRTAEERARIRKMMSERFKRCVPEWRVLVLPDSRVCLESATHDDDVRLYLNGNWNMAQQLRVADEICAQLNAAEATHDET